MGQTKDRLAMLETIGDKNNLKQAPVMLGFPNDAPQIILRNSAILIRFLKNTVPEWSNSSDWAKRSIKQLSKYPEMATETVKGNKRIKMQLIKDLGVTTMTVKHK